jgi:Na+-driven multidrug efflux pump
MLLTILCLLLVVTCLSLSARAKQRGDVAQARQIAGAGLFIALLAVGSALRSAWRAGQDHERAPVSAAAPAGGP